MMYHEERQDLFLVYIVTNKNHTTLYIGVTGNIKQRLKQHGYNSNKGFTGKYNINKLIYFESFKYPNLAIKREKQLKKWNREWKINLVNEINPKWEDLSWRVESL